MKIIILKIFDFSQVVVLFADRYIDMVIEVNLTILLVLTTL